MVSNSPEAEEVRNCLHPPDYLIDAEYEDDFMDVGDEEPEPPLYAKEQRCARCYGSGQDRDGADCVHCDGYGTVLV